MSNVFPICLDLEVLHIRLEHFHLNPGQAEHGSVIVDQLSDERGCAPEPLRFVLDGGGLLGREAEGLGEVVVSPGCFGHWIGFPFASDAVLAPLRSLVKLKKDLIQSERSPWRRYLTYLSINSSNVITVKFLRGGFM